MTCHKSNKTLTICLQVFLVAVLVAGLGPVPTPRVYAAGEFTDIGVALAGVIASSVAWGDYDNDGDLDILIAGASSTSSGSGLAKIYRNDSGGIFTDIGAALTGVFSSSVAWGDYDNDGDLDILLTGTTNDTSGISKVYRNDGGNVFTDINAGLTDAYYTSVAWGDYDNDGDLDILLAGRSGSYPGPYAAITKVYRNDENSIFTDVNAILAGVMWGSAAWGDYDNDGDLDILLAGCPDGDSCSGSSIRLYRNNGGAFSEVVVTLPAVSRGAAAWGDYDNDGDLDIVRTGWTGSALFSGVYRNDGNGVFTDIGAGLTGVDYASVAWGDYNNDGRLDILLVGNAVASGVSGIAKVYRNDGSGVFTDIGSGLLGVMEGSVAWGDYDNDGDLDILLTGCTQAYCNGLTRIYRNNAASPNSVPSSPTGLEATTSGRSAILSWSAASDIQTPANGLTYNLRVGGTPDGSEIAAAMSAGNGYRLVPQPGNIQHGITATLTSLTANATYYWSVQAIDTAFSGSAFAGEQSFTMPPPTVQFDASAFSANENNGTVLITVTLSAPSALTITVGYATGIGTAIAGNDYLAVTGTLLFTPGVTAQTFNVPILEDALNEPGETIPLVLSSPVSATLGAPNAATLTIVDDDPLVRFSSSVYSVNEAVSTAAITATLSAASPLTVTVDYATSPGTALAGSDYLTVTGTLIFAPGITAKTFNVPILDDALIESNETITLTLGNLVNALSGAPNPATLIIVDDDPKVRFTNSTYSISENGGIAPITVTLSTASPLTISVHYATSNNTALAGSDYLSATGTLTFTPGVTTQSFGVPILDDGLTESNEVVVLTLNNPVSATLGSPNPVGLIILDNDPLVRFSSSVYTTTENVSAMPITAVLNPASALTVTVDYATNNGTAIAGSDYLPTSGTLTFAPGVTVRTFNVPILDDAFVEPNETLTLALSNPINALLTTPNVATLTLVDNDPTVQLSSNGYTVNEELGAATLTATLNAALGVTVTVNYTTSNETAQAGSDYISTTGTLTFTPGVIAQNFSVPILDDAIDEVDETLRLTLFNAANASVGTPYTATLTIVDDDPPPTIQFDRSVFSAPEYAHGASITVTLSTSSTLPITVDYATANGTALAGSDYLPITGTLTFTPGIRTQTFSVPIINDGLDETDEALTLALSNPGNATLGATDSAILTIIDNDPVAPLIVTKAEDTNDGLCSLADCSLREAIMAANTAPGDDIILVPAGIYTLTLGELGVSSYVTVNGAGAASTVIDGNGTNRVFNITGDVIVTFQDMSLTGGRPGLDAGGAILNYGGTLTLVNTRLANNYAFNGGGGLLTFAGNVTLINSTVMSNVAEYGGGAGILNYGSGPLNIVNSAIVGNQAYGAYYGGGIWSQGPLTVTGSLIANNNAEFGGGVFNSGSLFTSDSVFSGNSAHFGGGIESRSEATLIRVQLVGNSAGEGGGGGMRHLGGVLLRDSAVVSNTTSGAGGGVAGSVGSWTVVNTTFSGNQASSGGAIVNSLSTESTRLTLNNVTIANNVATNGVGGLAGNRVDFKNTILAGNTGITPDCSGSLTSQGYNLIQDTTGCVILGDLTGNLTGVLAGLGPLQDNGGTTFTHALLPGSPAMDAGNPATPGSGGNACEATDQRDVIRPQGLGCDIGAYEAFASAVIAPDSGGTITITSSITTAISFPPGAVAQPITVTVQLTTSQPVSSGLLLVGEPFVVEARDTNDTPVTTFAQSFTITIYYDDADVAGVDEASLKLYFWNANAGQWVEIPTSVDTVANTLTANVAHLTTFAVLGKAQQWVYLPLILK
jgi:CSLREA domain-containing protein